MLKRYSNEEIFRDLELMGISKGDVILCKVDLLSVGLVSKDPKNGFLKALMHYLGPTGTIVSPAYSQTHFLPFINKNKKIFNINDIPSTGGFARSILMHPNSVRSTHPTNSFLALGKYAKDILADHNHKSHSYQPVQASMELDAKGIILGCLDSNPGHLTAHLVQYDLGQSTKNIFRGLSGACFYEDGRLKTFYRKDFGGHASGAVKFYEHYERHGVIKYGTIGSSKVGISKLRDSYDIEKTLFLDDPKFMLCDDPLCFSCRASWRYNMQSIPGYVATKVINYMKNTMGSA
tara:strand:- start:15279 stop:16151 length:873 start_codon:yes stop_codon:yes gene_type:complete